MIWGYPYFRKHPTAKLFFCSSLLFFSESFETQTPVFFSSFFLDSGILMRGRIIYFKKAFLDGLFFATIWGNYKCVREVHWGSWCNGLTKAILGPFPFFQSTEPGRLRCITVLHINYSRLYISQAVLKYDDCRLPSRYKEACRKHTFGKLVQNRMDQMKMDRSPPRTS